MTGTPFSYTFFSTMPAGTQIAPHYGPCNLKLRLHLPLFVPRVKDEKLVVSSTNVPPLYLRVADRVHTWQEGQLVIFDDTYEHEAGNMVALSDLADPNPQSSRGPPATDRVVLLIDIWHPELSEGEIEAIKEMFRKMDEMIR